MAKKKTDSIFKNEVFDLVGDEYTVLDKYIDAKTKIRFLHNKCKHITIMNPNKFLGGQRCRETKICKLTRSTEMLRAEITEKSNGTLTLISEYTGCDSEVTLKCNCGNEFKLTPHAFKHGVRCPICTTYKNKKITTLEFKNRIYKLFGNEYELISEYNGLRSKIKAMHIPCGTIFEVVACNLIGNMNSRCPKCTKNSKGEYAILKYLNKNSLDFNTEFSIESDRKRYDFKVGNILIEFDGIQHFNPKRRGNWAKAKSLKQQEEVDLYKTNLALFNGYKLVRISYTEIGNIGKILDEVFLKGKNIEDLSLYGKEYN